MGQPWHHHSIGPALTRPSRHLSASEPSSSWQTTFPLSPLQAGMDASMAIARANEMEEALSKALQTGERLKGELVSAVA